VHEAFSYCCADVRAAARSEEHSGLAAMQGRLYEVRSLLALLVQKYKYCRSLLALLVKKNKY
jgi:hypothetical protein